MMCIKYSIDLHIIFVIIVDIHNLNEEIRTAFELDKKVTVPTLILIAYKLLWNYNSDK